MRLEETTKRMKKLSDVMTTLDESFSDKESHETNPSLTNIDKTQSQTETNKNLFEEVDKPSESFSPPNSLSCLDSVVSSDC